jgi:hypothetical protein
VKAKASIRNDSRRKASDICSSSPAGIKVVDTFSSAAAKGRAILKEPVVQTSFAGLAANPCCLIHRNGGGKVIVLAT